MNFDLRFKAHVNTSSVEVKSVLDSAFDFQVRKF